MKIYISGKISGRPIEEAEKQFREAAARLQAEGHTTVVPFDNGLPVSATWREHMAEDLKMLRGCEAVHMLEGWEDSPGARIEHHMAKAAGLVITYASEGQKAAGDGE